LIVARPERQPGNGDRGHAGTDTHAPASIAAYAHCANGDALERRGNG
jgi:hypothetical protein